MEELNNSQQVISTFFSDSLNDEDTESESDNSRNDNAQRGGEEEASGQSQYLFNCPETKKIRKDSLWVSSWKETIFKNMIERKIY